MTKPVDHQPPFWKHPLTSASSGFLLSVTAVALTVICITITLPHGLSAYTPFGIGLASASSLTFLAISSYQLYKTRENKQQRFVKLPSPEHEPSPARSPKPCPQKSPVRSETPPPSAKSSPSQAPISDNHDDSSERLEREESDPSQLSASDDHDSPSIKSENEETVTPQPLMPEIDPSLRRNFVESETTDGDEEYYSYSDESDGDFHSAHSTPMASAPSTPQMPRPASPTRDSDLEDFITLDRPPSPVAGPSTTTSSQSIAPIDIDRLPIIFSPLFASMTQFLKNFVSYSTPDADLSKIDRGMTILIQQVNELMSDRKQLMQLAAKQMGLRLLSEEIGPILQSDAQAGIKQLEQIILPSPYDNNFEYIQAARGLLSLIGRKVKCDREIERLWIDLRDKCSALNSDRTSDDKRDEFEYAFINLVTALFSKASLDSADLQEAEPAIQVFLEAHRDRVLYKSFSILLGRIKWVFFEYGPKEKNVPVPEEAEQKSWFSLSKAKELASSAKKAAVSGALKVADNFAVVQRYAISTVTEYLNDIVDVQPLSNNMKVELKRALADEIMPVLAPAALRGVQQSHHPFKKEGSLEFDQFYSPSWEESIDHYRKVFDKLSESLSTMAR